MRKLSWGICVALWALFTFWYTDFGGPLSDAEIDEYLSRMDTGSGGAMNLERLRTFLENDTGRQFLMVNVVDYADDPPDMPGAAPGASAQDLMDIYMEHMYAQLFRRACHPTTAGGAVFGAMDLVGMNTVFRPEAWDMGAFMRYRSRRTFMDIITHPDMSDRHEFKMAALDKTVAFPIETQIYLGDPRLLLGLFLLVIALLLDRLFSRR